jgi:hypothetical protein
LQKKMQKKMQKSVLLWQLVEEMTQRQKSVWDFIRWNFIKKTEYITLKSYMKVYVREKIPQEKFHDLEKKKLISFNI